MARIVSFVVLVAILVVMAFLFIEVMAGFLLPMFLAVLLAVVFQPVQLWFVAKLGGRLRVAAGLTTLAAVLVVLLPLALILFQAFREVVTPYLDSRRAAAQAGPAASDSARASAPVASSPVAPERLAADAVRLARELHLSLSQADIEKLIREKYDQWLAPVMLESARFTGGFLLGFAVMVISLYYFLADGPTMIREVMRLSPLEDQHEQQLVDEFVRITRAIVLATLLSALAQGLLAGVGFAIVGLERLFLLTVVTMFMAMVPFVGATAVWAPVALWLYFIDQRHGAGIFMAIYGAGVVSLADNLIKPLVLHGRSNMHPLLALLSVLGGVQALGPIGIFVGPMAVAFLHALLKMFQREVERMGSGGVPALSVAGGGDLAFAEAGPAPTPTATGTPAAATADPARPPVTPLPQTAPSGKKRRR